MNRTIFNSVKTNLYIAAILRWMNEHICEGDKFESNYASYFPTKCRDRSVVKSVFFAVLFYKNSHSCFALIE